MLFLFWSSVTYAWSFNRYDNVNELIKLLILAQVFVLGSRLENLKPIFVGMSLGLFIHFILSIFYNGGLFVNSSIAGEIAVLAIIGLIISKELWLIPPLAAGIVLSGSRTAIVALLTTIFLYCYSLSKKIALGALAIALMVGIASFYIKSGGTYQRFDIWKDAFNGFTLLGHGSGSFHAAYPFFSDSNVNTYVERPKDAHNDFIQVMFETGIVGLILVTGFLSILMRTNQNEKYIIAAFIVTACLSFPIHTPVSAFIFAIVAGFMSRNLSNLFDTFNVGRISTSVRT